MTSRQRFGKPIGRPQTSKLTVAQALDRARMLLSRGDVLVAEPVLTSILKAKPEEPGALHLLGSLRNMQGQFRVALELLEQAVRHLPLDPAPWNDLGLVYAKLNRDDDAMEAYRRSIALADHTPLAAKSWDNLGRLLLKVDVMEAEQAFRQATQIAPDFGLGWYGLAQALVNQGRLDEALQTAAKAVRLMPKSLARALFASALATRGHRAAAIRFYRDWLAEDPQNAVVQHHLRALTDPQSPQHASAAYIQTAFDGFALSFDSKLAQLHYLAPEQIRDAVQVHYPQRAAALDIADLGCGTGLCAPLLVPWARHLCGVDLSARMLALASERGLYHALHQGELLSFLDAQAKRFDVLIAADTFCYFGSLFAPLIACAKALRGAGHVFFTLEALLEDDFAHRLASTGRFAHSQAHVHEAAQRAGLSLLGLQTVILRTERDEPVKGWVVSLRKPPPELQ